MPNFEIAFVDNNGNPIPDGTIVTAYTNDGAYTVLETETTGNSPATPGQGSTLFQYLSPNVTYQFGFSQTIVGFRTLTLPSAPQIVVPTGVTGPPGPIGLTGPQGQGLTWSGTWNNVSSYSAYSVVYYNGSAYIATTTNENATPGISSSWSLIAAQGAAGTPGAAGPPGATGPAGTSFTWMGPYNSGTTYAINQVVQYNGSTYISIAAPNTNNNPATASSDWQLMTSIGATGPTGPAGANGINGTNGTSFTWMGLYVNSTAYTPNQVVSYTGSSYICTANSTGNLPTNGTYWALVAQAGTTGANGSNGATGPTGPTGHGSTTTTAAVTSNGSGTSVIIHVVDGTAFPNLSFIAVSDGTNIVFGQITSGGTTQNLTANVLYPISSTTVAISAAATFGGPLVNSFNFYDISGQYNSIVPSSANIQTVIAPRSFKIVNNGNNYAYCTTTATASAIFVIAKNGSQIGNIVYVPGNNTGTVNITSTTTFNANDRLTVTAPVSSDATLASIAYTLGGVVY